MVSTDRYETALHLFTKMKPGNLRYFMGKTHGFPVFTIFRPKDQSRDPPESIRKLIQLEVHGATSVEVP